VDTVTCQTPGVRSRILAMSQPDPITDSIAA
jgi:hypothetical protein